HVHIVNFDRLFCFFFSSRRRHTRSDRDWSSDVCSSDLSAIRALLGLTPKTARRLRDDGGEEDVSLDEVRPGDRLRVRPGERVPVDGVALEGTSAVGEAMVTGEPIPVEKAPRSRRTGGTVTGTGG